MKIIDISKRKQNLGRLLKYDSGLSRDIDKKVALIISKISKQGDKALINFTRRFDRVSLVSPELKVTKEEILAAREIVDKEFKITAKRIKANIERYYREEKKYLKSGWKLKYAGKILGQITTPLERIGVYIPGGSAPLISTVFMTVIPAKVAGVKEIVAVSPPSLEKKINPFIIYALDLLGVKNIYKAGGAQGIAALGLGTKTIPRVDKIIGPGNIYVAAAKKQLVDRVGIDMLAGPSEVMILADGKADYKFIAADLLSQAEHDVLSRAVLVTTSKSLAQKVKPELARQLAGLKRKSIAKRALTDFGSIIIVKSIQQGIDLINEAAPEHLEIMAKNIPGILPKIKNAGAIFLGDYTPVACGDFIAGPSHVLPTAGSAKFSSYLSLESFLKKSSFVAYNKKTLRKESRHLMKIAGLEGLDAHSNSVKIRIKEKS